MPLPSASGVGSTVGKRLFGTSNPTIIARKIQKLGKTGDLQKALKDHGVRGGLTARKMADVLTGKADPASTRQLGGAIRALQAIGATVEPDTKVGTILAESSRRALQDETYKQTGALRPNALNLGMKASLGARVAAARLANEGGEHQERPLEQARSIREVRETLRALGMAEKRTVRRALPPVGEAVSSTAPKGPDLF
jgi:hypothetical protein